MKPFLLLVFLALMVPATAFSQAAQFALSSEANGPNCLVVDDQPGIVVVHMFVENAGDVIAVQYAAPKPDCWAGATWIGDNMAFPVTIGDTQMNDPRGMSVAFGQCLPSPVYLGSMTFQTSGAGAPCCEFDVIKVLLDLHPEIPGPIMVVCPNTNQVVGLSSGAVINAGPECGCNSVLPTEASTWGAVKQLYRQP